MWGPEHNYTVDDCMITAALLLVVNHLLPLGGMGP